MFTAIATIALIYFLWLVVKPWAARYMQRKFQQKVNDMFRQAYGGGASQGNDPFEAYAKAQEAYRQQQQRGPRRKIFSRDEGEYIEFEEVHVHAEYTSDTTAHNPSGYTPREPQISDAEWEEIK